MRILVISNTPWDNSNSFGNTFSNIFEGMENVEIYNVCCRNGLFNNGIVKRAVQLTDKSVLKSIYKLGYDPCHVMQYDTAEGGVNEEISEKARAKRRFVSFLIRDAIWMLGRWRKSKTLTKFLEETRPDIVYMPMYKYSYLLNVQLHLIKKMNVPVVAHITDDIYSYNTDVSFYEKWYKRTARRKIRKIISNCSYIEVFAETMKEEYEKIFDKPCHVIGKGINLDELKPVVYKQHEGSVSFVYTGNIGDERYKSLYSIGKALDELRGDREAILNIYSATPLNDEMKTLFSSSPSIKFHGAVSRVEVEEIQRNADYLVHVEGFSEKAIHAVKMSFSTKIVDYLVSGKPILAVGPYEVNSIKVLKDEGVAVVATTEDEVKSGVAGILNGSVDLDELGGNVEKYLIEKRDIKKIQAGIKTRLDELVKK